MSLIDSGRIGKLRWALHGPAATASTASSTRSPTATVSPDAATKFRQEYHDAGGEDELSVTEDEYVRTCLDDPFKPRASFGGDQPAATADTHVVSSDPSAAFRKEFRDNGGEDELDVTEDEYVATCLKDPFKPGGDVVPG